jgi:hypothetical protein
MKSLFEAAWVSMQHTIRPSARSVELIQLARKELAEKIAQQNPRSIQGESDDAPGAGYIGVHFLLRTNSKIS